MITIREKSSPMYVVKCDQNPELHTSKVFNTGRSTAWSWNSEQKKLTGEESPCKINWVDKRVRMPWESDADAYGCVLIWDRLNGVKVTGWKNIHELNREAVTHWARMPEGPRI